MPGVHRSERAEGEGRREEGGQSWGPAGVGSSLLLVSITSALAPTTLIWRLCYPPAGLPAICSVPRGLRDLSILKSDPVGPWLTVCHGNYNNALPGPARAPHELALAHLSDLISYHCFLPSALEPSVLQPIPGLCTCFSAPPSHPPYSSGSAQMLPSLFTLPKWPSTPATGCQIPLLEYLASLSGEPAPTST